MLTIILGTVMGLLRAEQAMAADQADLTANIDPHHVVLEIKAGKGAHLDLALAIVNIMADPTACSSPTLLRCSRRLALPPAPSLIPT